MKVNPSHELTHHPLIFLHGINATTLFEAKDHLCHYHRQQHHVIHHFSSSSSDDLPRFESTYEHPALFETDNTCFLTLICPSPPTTPWLNYLTQLTPITGRYICVLYYAAEARYKKTKWCQQLSRSFHTQEYPNIYGQKLNQWLHQCIQQHDVPLTSSQQRQLTQQTQGNQTLMKRVIQQCQLAYPQQTIPSDEFQALLQDLTPTRLFQILDHALLGHPLGVLEHIHKLTRDQQYSLFWMTNQAVMTTQQLMTPQAKPLPAWQQKKYDRLIQRITPNLWTRIIDLLCQCERQLKGLESGSFSVSLSSLLLNLSRRKATS